MKGSLVSVSVVGMPPVTLILPPGNTAGAAELRVLWDLIKDDGA